MVDSLRDQLLKNGIKAPAREGNTQKPRAADGQYAGPPDAAHQA